MHIPENPLGNQHEASGARLPEWIPQLLPNGTAEDVPGNELDGI